MKHKLMMLALAAVSAVFFALPAAASAAEWSIDSETGALPTFTTSGGAAKLSSTGFGSFLPVECTGNSGSGKYTSATTSVVSLKFTGCTQGSAKCTNTAEEETIETTKELVSHNIMIENTATAGGTPGLLITPTSGHFATFKCGSSTLEVKGNGIIGDISSPKCGAAFNKTATVDFKTSSSGNQLYKQVETTGTSYDLSTTTAFGTFTSGEDATGTVTFNQGTKMTCP
jgi:hypothetical protein